MFEVIFLNDQHKDTILKHKSHTVNHTISDHANDCTSQLIPVHFLSYPTL